MSTESDYVTVPVAAAALGVSVPTVWRYLRRGLPSTKVYNRRLVPLREALAWLETRGSAAGSPRGGCRSGAGTRPLSGPDDA